MSDAIDTGALRPFPLNPAYLVCPTGRVLRFDRTGWLAPCVMKRGGYHAVNLWDCGKAHLWTLNKIVAWTFHGTPPTPKHHAAHHDGVKSNNHRDNIAWKTKAENEADKILHGTTNRGERNGQAKLTDAQAREVLARAPTMRPYGRCKTLGEEYGVSSSAISNIICGRRHQHAP